MHRPDAIRVQIAQDGTLTVTTDDISMPNHREADELLNLLNQLAGGQTEVIERPERLPVTYTLEAVRTVDPGGGREAPGPASAAS